MSLPNHLMYPIDIKFDGLGISDAVQFSQIV